MYRGRRRRQRSGHYGGLSGFFDIRVLLRSDILAETDCCIDFWLVDGPDMLNVLSCLFRRPSAVGGNLVSFICSLVYCAPPDTFLVLDTLDGWMAL
jgi:hypothetical protein